nr:RNA-directed DNA polymerase, eukaryota [Tanacetum cinerariifolium]GEZ81579.1 RNA-directed DNA polymerase, eukaryota [Tanacetum cinerariifolium]
LAGLPSNSKNMEANKGQSTSDFKVDNKSDGSYAHVVNGGFPSEVDQDFVSEERIAWVDIEGVPIRAWSVETFSLKGKVFMIRAKELFTWSPNFLTNKETECLSDDESIQSENHILKHSNLTEEDEGEFKSNDVDGVTETIFGGNSVSDKRHSEEPVAQESGDPFKIFELLNENKSRVEPQVPSPSLSHPPGFSPAGHESNLDKVHENGEVNEGPGVDSLAQIDAEVVKSPQLVRMEGSSGSVGQSVESKGGSILGVLEEKSKVRWAIEGDENSSFFHGIIKKNISQLAIRGILVDGSWKYGPQVVKEILDGPLIINELLHWCKRKNKRAMFFKVDFRKAYDLVRWDYLIDVLEDFGFGLTWCQWIRGLCSFAKASVLVNGTPSSKFQFHCGLKQGDPLAPFLFILVMESLHLSFSRVVEAGIFKGGNMSRCKAWSDIVSMLSSRISKWNTKTLSIGGRLTLLKSVLDNLDKKITWVAWDKVLASKKNGGLGVSSYFALNWALLFKWIWRFVSQDDSLWFHVMQASVCEGIELVQFNKLRAILELVSLSHSHDRWICNASSDGSFRVKDIQNLNDDLILPLESVPTKWMKYVPININIFVWRARRDCLPTRENLMRRGVVIESTDCPICSLVQEDVHHILFQCDLAHSVLRRICRWWDID